MAFAQPRSFYLIGRYTNAQSSPRLSMKQFDKTTLNEVSTAVTIKTSAMTRVFQRRIKIYSHEKEIKL